MRDRAAATSYTYEVGGIYPISDVHWEQYVFRFDPGSGWTGALMRGNEAGMSGFLTVLADDGSSGQRVNLNLVFEVSFYSSYVLGGWGFNISDETQALANFAGMDSGTVSSEFGFTSGDLGTPWGPQPVARDFLDNGAVEMNVRVPFPVGYEGGEDGWSRSFEISTGHVEFDPSGLHVFDESLPAVFAVDVEVYVRLAGAAVVSESEETAALLIVALGGLAFLGLRMKDSLRLEQVSERL
jgi:hypothetical protein